MPTSEYNKFVDRRYRIKVRKRHIEQLQKELSEMRAAQLRSVRRMVDADDPYLDWIKSEDFL